MSGDSKPVIAESALEKLERLRAQAGGKRIVPMPMVKGIGHLIVDHSLILEVLSSTNFIRAPYLSDAFGEGLLLAEGERWSISRPTIQPFYSAKQISRHAERLGQFADELRDSWLDAARSGREVAFVRDLVGLVFRSSVFVMSGVDVGPNDPRGISVIRLTGAANQLSGLGIFDPKSLISPAMAGALRDERKVLEEFSRELGEAHQEQIKSQSQSDCLLSRLMSSEFLDASVNGCPIGGKGLIDEIVLLLQASVETTTASIGNTIELLAANPEDLERLREEIKEVGNDPAQPLPWSTACYREGLRLRPPVWFNGRQALEKFELSSGDIIEQGGFVFICPYLVHRDPELWAEPEEYRPQRFIDKPVRENSAYLPFGLGRHYCIGAGLATMVATGVLRRVFGTLNITPQLRASAEPLEGFLLGPTLDSTAIVTPIDSN